MRHLASKSVETAFLSSRGKFRFRIVPELSKNIYLRMAQHRHYNNEGFRVRWSTAVVEAKLKNQRNFLIRSRRNQPDADIEKEISMLETSIKGLNDKKSVDEIMGAEGFGSKTFFRAYGKLIRGEFKFVKREYYPPPDPVNALLSFGYMLVFNELNGLLEAFGFDVYLGFLHSIRYGRASPASDLIEELRSPVVDRLVIYLINLDVIKPSQFTATENRGVRMDERALKAYLKNYEKFMTASFVTREGDQKNYRKVVRESVENAERVLLDNIDYSPYILHS